MQTVLCTFNEHTVFSIFANSVKFHEQMLQQVNEQDFLEEEQEDETLLESNILRRLYRVLTLPTPDIEEDNKRENAEFLNDYFDDDFYNGESYVGPASVVAIEGGETKSLLEQSQLVPGTESATDANEKSGLRSVLFKSLYNKSSRIKDCLLSITNRCSECGISNFCED
jgi:hypothetical protein